MQLLRELHVETLQEVLRMRRLTPEQIGINYRALLDLIGEERAMEDIVRRKGEQWVRAALERLTNKPVPSGEEGPQESPHV